MTRILAFADTQIGVSTVMLDDQRKVLDQIVSLALERDVDMVLHGGDVFEGPVVLPEQMRMFLDATVPLRPQRRPPASQHIPMLVIRGNGRHDMATRHVHALDVLREIDGITVSDRPQGIRRDGVSIITLPWVHPGALIAKRNGGIDHERVNEMTAELLIRIAGDLRAQAPAGDMTVLLAHWAISGSKLPTGLAVEEMHEPILPWADLDSLGFDIVIGAHIHQPQIISNPEIDMGQGIVLGSPQQLNFGEHGDHGCWIIEIDEAGARPEFIPLEAPHFITYDFDHEDPVAQLALTRDVGWAELASDYVRVRIKASEEQAQRIDHEAIRRELIAAGAANVKIEPQIIKANRARVDTITEQLTQVEALTLWGSANKVEPELMKRMIARLQEWL